jgi:hypothetical protein
MSREVSELWGAGRKRGKISAMHHSKAADVWQQVSPQRIRPIVTRKYERKRGKLASERVEKEKHPSIITKFYYAVLEI